MECENISSENTKGRKVLVVVIIIVIFLASVTAVVYFLYSANKEIIWIHNIYELQNIKNNLNGHYALANDIDASITRTWNNGKGFEPIGTMFSPFTGTFDGNGHKIINLYINRSTRDNVGLFGYVNGGVIKNVGLVDVNVSGYCYVGALAGKNYKGIVNNSYVIGNLRGNDTVGGLVGENNGVINNSYAIGNVSEKMWGNTGGLVGVNNGIVTESYAICNINGRDYVGGLIGVNYGLVSNSYAIGNVTGDTKIGGLIGLNNKKVNRSYTIGNVKGEEDVGGLIGENRYTGFINNSYSTANVTGRNNTGGLVGKNLGKVSNTHYNVDRVWINKGHYLTIGGLFGYQYNDWFSHGLHLDISDYSSALIPNGDYYQINSVQGLKDLLGFADMNYKFRLVKDLDLSSEPNLYVPYFVGEFDGNNHTISNLNINISFASGVGLFGSNLGAVKNIGLMNLSVTGGWYVGGLMGINNGTTDNIYVMGLVEGGNYVGGLIGENRGKVNKSHGVCDVNGIEYVGGLVGENDGLINNSYAMGDVKGNNNVGGLVGTNCGIVSKSYAISNVWGRNSIGGLIGNNYYNGKVKGSYARGNVSGSSYVGGLVGDSDKIVSNSYAVGNVSGYDHVGGLIGSNGGIVNNNYATGNVKGEVYVGGLVGWNDKTVSDSYATVNVKGCDYSGGLIGWNDGTVNNSYATGSVSGCNYSGGLIGENDGVISKSHTIGDVYGYNYVGGFIGYNIEGFVSNSYAVSNVSGHYYTGGFIGFNDLGTVRRSYTRGNVSGYYYVGGFVGWNDGVVNNSYAISNVRGNWSVGGLVGANCRTVRYAYAAGKVSGASNVGGLIGLSLGGTTLASFWDINATGQKASAGGVGKTTKEMKERETYLSAGWDFVHIWDIIDGVCYPFLRWQNGTNIPRASHGKMPELKEPNEHSKGNGVEKNEKSRLDCEKMHYMVRNEKNPYHTSPLLMVVSFSSEVCAKSQKPGKIYLIFIIMHHHG